MHAEDRAEDLLLRRRVGVVGQVEHGRLEVVAPVEAGRAAAAGDDLAAVLLGQRRRYRSHRSRWAALMTGPIIVRRLGRRADRERAVGRRPPPRAPRPCARRGTSMRVAATHAWPAVIGDHRAAPAADPVDRVGQVDLRRLAAELERDALHRRRGLGQDLLARPRSSR